ncbi:MAG: HAD family hydrolase [Candidatus Caldarchaeum sp.]
MRAVFFDFDNTLVDSLSVLPAAQRRAAELIAGFLGGDVDVEEVLSVVRLVERVVEMQGVYDRDVVWAHVLRELGFDGRPEAGVLRSWTHAYWEEYSKGKPFPDAVKVLAELQKHRRLGLITNTDGLLGMKRRRLSISGLERFFDVVVVAGEDTPEAKPSPRPFLKAVSVLGLRPGDCLMVGDDPVNDVAGSKSAGLAAVLVDRRGGRPCPVKPDYVVSSLTQVLEVVGGISFLPSHR